MARSGAVTSSVGLGTRPRAAGAPTAYARRVLDCVEAIPAGRVLTYGDVADFVGGGSGRVVGNVMHHHGHEVSWWRVVLSTGYPAPSDPTKALELLAADGVALLPGRERVDLAAARWDGL